MFVNLKCLWRVVLALIAVVVLVSPCPEKVERLASSRPAAPDETPVLEQGVMVPMRDGVRLATDIARPRAGGSFPTVLMRTPYGRTTRAGQVFLKAGYAFVCQDTRGRYQSEGICVPFVNEGRDGYDTIEWIAGRPWSNGDVVMAGASYAGVCQLLAAMERPPHLRCIAPTVPCSNFDEGVYFFGGALRLEVVLGWLLGQTWTGKLVRDNTVLAREFEKWYGDTQFQRWRRYLPLETREPLDIGGRSYGDTWSEIVSNWENPDRWRAQSAVHAPKKITVPTLIIGGFLDLFCQGNIDLLFALRQNGGRARDGAHLVMGPWGHTIGESVGAMDFPDAVAAVKGIELRWFERWLGTGAESNNVWPAMRFYLMNSNRWIDTDQWPPRGSKEVKLYLGEKSLDRSLPTLAGSESRFTYHPDDPVPTLGGANLTIISGIRDHAALAERKDVVVFRGTPLTNDLTVAGPVRVELFVASDRPDTDFIAWLVDEAPGGFQANLLDGVKRLRYRNGRDQPALNVPSEIVPLTIDLWSTAWTFRKGHRIVLYISSSNFPRFDRNLNIADHPAKGSKGVPARNTVYHDRAHPSALILNLISF